MATIEPRLIHLLNDSQSPHLSHSNLPPLQDLPFPDTNPLRPHPLEPDAGQRGGDGPALSLVPKSSFPSLYRPLDDPHPPLPSKPPSRNEDGPPFYLEGRLSTMSSMPSTLRMILDDDVDLPLHDPAPPSTVHPLRKLLADHSQSTDDLNSKKRHHALTGKEDFVQLPHPLKKQKSSSTVHMPPIIQGLHEPPPNAALFPPISSSSFDDPDQLNLLRDIPARSDDKPQSISSVAPPSANRAATSTLAPVAAAPPSAPPLPASASAPALASTPTSGPSTYELSPDIPITSATTTTAVSGKVKRRAAKPRRKWSEEETKHLLLGVHKHGVGRWTDILEDPEFHFNDRTAGDLKDRFRTCCPDELRSRKDKEKDRPSVSLVSEPRPKLQARPLQIESILGPDEPQKPESPTDTGPNGKARKSRAHRKNMGDLAELGIHTPFKKSLRRERRPFSDQDDKEILLGFEKYGPQWAKIQRDPKFNLSNRQATDLRDRLRNKRPDLFNNPKAPVKDSAKCGPLEPSVNMAGEHSPTMSRSNTSSMTSLNHSNSREDIPKWPSATSDWPESAPHPAPPHLASLNDMGISRLLLDDSHVNYDSRKQVSSSLSPVCGLPAPHSAGRSDFPGRGVISATLSLGQP